MASTSKILTYAGIFHGHTPLVEHEESGSKMSHDLALIVIEKITLDEDAKQSFVHENLCLHYITRGGSIKAPDGITYITVTPSSSGRKPPFMFLLELEALFERKYLSVSDSIEDVLPKHRQILGDLKDLMNRTEKGENDVAGLARSEIEQVKNIMVENVERLLERGERINLLVSKTDRMNNNAVVFRKRSSAVKRNMWWANIKMLTLLILAGLALIYFFLGFFCGFPGMSIMR